MVGFFRNAFQQTGFTPTEDFKIQLLQNGGFDFGRQHAQRRRRRVPAPGAEPAGQLRDDRLAAGARKGARSPETLTTNRFVMTTALKSLYVQIEMPADTTVRQRRRVARLDGRLQRQLDPDRAGADEHGVQRRGARHPTIGDRHRHRTAAAPARSRPARSRARRCCSSACSGSRRASRFHGNATICDEHASKPYFTTDDLSDWTWVTINPKANAGRSHAGRSSPTTCRRCAPRPTLTLSLPRVGFYTTPAFLALWNTNDSNQHRVTANQTLLAALGQSFTQRTRSSPFSPDGPRRHARGRRHASASAATRRWIRCASSGRTSSTSTTATTSRRRNRHERRGNPRPTRHAGRRVRVRRRQRRPGPSITDCGGYLAQVTDGGRAAPLRRSRSRSSSASTRTRRRAARATRSSAASSARSRTAAPTTSRC